MSGGTIPGITPHRRGPLNALTDVPGLRVGHHTAVGDGWLTGTTVVLADTDGAVAGVDVRGGGPGTRETDLLDPRNAVERVHAVVLSGGSAFGLSTADGVLERLAEAGVGVQVAAAAPSEQEPAAAPAIVPIVPAAVVFDLGRGGRMERRPTPAFGASAYDVAAASEPDAPVLQGAVGAGTGAVAGGIKGGVGTASAVLDDGTTVAALIVVNPVGSTVDPVTGALYGARHGLGDEFADLAEPSPEDLRAFRASFRRQETTATLHTTIGVVATDAALTKAQCAKVAGIGHDGLARAIRPVHTMLDGDTLFGLSTAARPAPDLLGLQDLLTAAADCVTRAVVHAVLAAETVTTPAGSWRSYLDLFPSVRDQQDDR